MPSTGQKAADATGEYDTDAHRFVDEKPKRIVLSVKPMTVANARDWLGGANEYGDDEMVEHFVDEIKRLQGEEDE